MDAHVIAMEGTSIVRDKALVDPKTIFDFLWTQFCAKAEKGPLPPILFFVQPDRIELYDFAAFTQSTKHKALMQGLIQQRVQEEQTIEGVAVCCEVFLRRMTPENRVDMDRAPSECPDSLDAVMLSFCWRGVEQTFMRTAEISKDGTRKLGKIDDSFAASGVFANFFGTDIPQKNFLV